MTPLPIGQVTSTNFLFFKKNKSFLVKYSDSCDKNSGLGPRHHAKLRVQVTASTKLPLQVLSLVFAPAENHLFSGWTTQQSRSLDLEKIQIPNPAPMVFQPESRILIHSFPHSKKHAKLISFHVYYQSSIFSSKLHFLISTVGNKLKKKKEKSVSANLSLQPLKKTLRLHTESSKDKDLS